jgi:phosphatidylglycerol:prolipoprotein diacylglycerol transferase
MYPVLFKEPFFGLEVRSYGVLVLVGFFAAYLLCRARAERYGFTKTEVADLSLWTLLFGIVGARVVFILQALPYYLEHTDQLFTWKFEGLTSFGGILFGIAFLIWFAKRRKKPVLAILDMASAPALVALAIGRIGCLLNGCCYGGHCDLPWGIPVAGKPGLYHPAQIYDLLMLMGVLAVQLKLERRPLMPGQSLAFTLFGYGVARFIYEFWRAGTAEQVQSREATSTYLGSLPITDAQLVALLMAAVFGYLWFWFGKRQAERPEAEE